MPYKMLALDLDNTLLYKDLTMAPAAGAALARLMSRGIFVTLATEIGRASCRERV